ncbi:MAG: thioredoxin family protein [Candidatus Woesearchaeota archaeon]
MNIEVYGMEGCSTCTNLKKDIEKFVEENNLDAQVKKVTDIAKMAKKGIMSSPTVAVDGEIVIRGKVPSYEELKELLM